VEEQTDEQPESDVLLGIMDVSPTLPSLAFLNSPFLHHFSIEESRFTSPSDEGLVAALLIPPIRSNTAEFNT